MKVGQFPPWSIDVDPSLDKTFGQHVSYFKKGLISESQGYGIGAFAYYRRIVELIIDQLLTDIMAFLSDETEHEDYRNALAKVKDDTRAEKRIEAVKDLVPAVLRPVGLTPSRSFIRH